MEWGRLGSLVVFCVDSELQDKESPVDNAVRRYTAHSALLSGLPSESVSVGAVWFGAGGIVW